mmetsp:Transcript_11945/g.33722  ORF Transcript_11945/g.33722 Transcript_11945/m.33722 type:complete len:104 (-) Transcript_11945:237-548(-)
MAGACAYFCAIMSAVGAALMGYMGWLCQKGSPMIQLPEKQKPDAGQGCMTAAALWAFTLLIALYKIKSSPKSASAREVSMEGRPLMPVVGSQADCRLRRGDGL